MVHNISQQSQGKSIETFAITELQVTVSLYVIIRLYSKRGSESIHSSESERAKVSSVTDIFCKREEDREVKKMQFLYIDVTLRAFETGKLIYFVCCVFQRRTEQQGSCTFYYLSSYSERSFISLLYTPSDQPNILPQVRRKC